MFNDVGVVAVTRTRDDGTVEPGFRVFVAGGLGANPHPAQALEEFTAREDLLPTIEAVLRIFDHYGNRDNKLRARMKWVVDELGIDELRRRIFPERKLPARLVHLARRHPRDRPEAGRRPGRRGHRRRPHATVGHARHPALGTEALRALGDANVVRGVAKGTVSAIRLGPARRHHLRPVPGAGRHQRELGARRARHQPAERRASGA